MVFRNDESVVCVVCYLALKVLFVFGYLIMLHQLPELYNVEW